MKMKYEIRHIRINHGFAYLVECKYRVDLWVGRTRYEGITRYERYDAALRAATRTGAKPKEKQA